MPAESTWQLPVAALAAFVSSALAARFLASPGSGLLHILDHPNERSLHQTPVPRTGGLGVLVGVVLAGATSAALGALPVGWLWIAAALILVGAISFLDDRAEVPRRWRLAAHFAAAGLLVAGGVLWTNLDLPLAHWRLPTVLALALTACYVVWMINLYNFMDGMDGFAGGMTVFGFGALAVLGWRAGDPGYASLAAGVAAAGAGFLTSNFPPARIFLGDAGSSTLGLLAAALSLLGAQRGLFPLWVAWLAFSPFIVDATWTLLRRLVRGERLWEAHRSHHYQRLVLAGWGHRKTVLWAYVLMAAGAATAVAAVHMTAMDQLWVLLVWAAIYVLLHLKVGLAERAVAQGGR